MDPNGKSLIQTIQDQQKKIEIHYNDLALNKAMMTLEIQRNMLPAKYQVQISDRLSIVRQGVLNVREADRRKIVLQTP